MTDYEEEEEIARCTEIVFTTLKSMLFLVLFMSVCLLFTAWWQGGYRFALGSLAAFFIFLVGLAMLRSARIEIEQNKRYRKNEAAHLAVREASR
jgi:hypothetical protein